MDWRPCSPNMWETQEKPSPPGDTERAGVQLRSVPVGKIVFIRVYLIQTEDSPRSNISTD